MSNKFAIRLDRANGVYYAGEVISGTLTVNGKGESCRSILLSCVGKARIHWHTGSGDNRHDYDGKKYFMESEHTVFGNFYRTTVLDNAGADAEFGGAFGDGDMHIPCAGNEGSNGSIMRLIVRVCDYDWGKRDDTCGEIVLNANELVKHGDAQTFPLTRNGKPEKGTVTLAATFVPTSALTKQSNQPNQSEETLVLKIIRANGLRKCDWVGNNDVYVQAWRAPPDLASPPPVGKKLPEPNKKIQLPNQQMVVPFAFPTRSSTPGSAALHAGDCAYIAYYLKAEIDKKGWRNPSRKVPITILPTRPAPMPPLLLPAVLETEDDIKSCKFCCFACGNKGSVHIRFQCPRRAFAPGETVNLTSSSIVNHSSIPITAVVVLRQHVELATTGIRASYTSDTERFTVGSSLTVDPGATVDLEDMKGLIIPAVPPSFYGSKGNATARREPLTFYYQLSLQAKAKSGHKVKLDLPILISALPPTVEAIAKAAASSSSNTSDKSFPVKSYAVLTDVPCDTVPIVTGLEDAGGAQLATTATGAVNIYEPDDNGSNLDAYYYQPQVAIFPTTTTTTTSNVSEGVDTMTTPTIAPAAAAAPVVVEEVDRVTAYNNLLETMKTEYDSRQAVDTWIKKYPSVASTLTPDEFADCLKGVVFSLEQPTVARELVGGFGSTTTNNLTTQHIQASIDKCPYSKLELIRVMAPYVSDPQNKESILNQLYSYEKEEANKCFAT